MAVDPTGWLSPIDAYAYWRDQTLAAEKVLVEFQTAYMDSPQLVERTRAERIHMLATDSRYVDLAADLRSARDVAAFWADAVQIRILEGIFYELQRRD